MSKAATAGRLLVKRLQPRPVRSRCSDDDDDHNTEKKSAYW
jgi:hypothetical protein